MAMVLVGLAVMLFAGMATAQERLVFPNSSLEEGEESPTGWVWHTGEGSGGESEWREDIARLRVQCLQAQAASELCWDDLGRAHR